MDGGYKKDTHSKNPAVQRITRLLSTSVFLYYTISGWLCIERSDQQVCFYGFGGGQIEAHAPLYKTLKFLAFLLQQHQTGFKMLGRFISLLLGSAVSFL